jgi:tripartite-type tricarboxylate transporter receptor subunit TctC
MTGQEMFNKHRMLSIALAAALIAGAGRPAAAEDKVADFYQGKTISVYIGSDVGGGYNVYAHAVWPVLVKHIPGNPKLIMLNMPGAGGRKATGYVANVVPKDGTAVGATQPGALTESVLGDPKNAKYDARNFGYIGSADASNYLCLARKDAKVKKFEDLYQHELVVGADSKGSSFTDNATLLNNVLGVKFKLVKGYKGFNDISIALERNEVQGLCGESWASLSSAGRHLLTGNKINILIQVAMNDTDVVTKMGVPIIWKYVKTDEQRKILELAISQQILGRPYFAPAHLPPERLNALRRAFDATMKDPEYIAIGKKQHLEMIPATGEQMAKVIDNIFNAPKELQKKTRAALYGQ